VNFINIALLGSVNLMGLDFSMLTAVTQQVGSALFFFGKYGKKIIFA